ncbi:hypothetical protein FACS189467_1260 [Bacteroidia bacterium]|nr:hypothetical protein FACS189467_1260 [Bacteroidia bacterium]
MSRPELNNTISVADFKDFYWLKEELIAFCKSVGISAVGGKRELADKIVHYLQTGTIAKNTVRKTYTSHFDWNTATLSLDTVITDNYKNSENVRAFMTKIIGTHFHFNVAFQQWTKLHIGATLGDAVAEWQRIYEQKKDKHYKTDILPQCEYNAYIRDFLADNKDLTLKDAIKCWNVKHNQRGSKKYSKDDLGNL